MNMVDFQEKMDPTHRIYLCRMLNVKELPEDLLERYAQVKRLVDRIDGHLTPGALAMIIISLGANPEIVTSLLDESDDKVIEEAVETPAEPPAHPYPSPVETPIEQPVSGATGQADDKPEKGKAMLWSSGMPVKVLQEDELKQGRIFAVHPGDGKEPVQLTVQLEGGDTVTVNEDEVEAI